MLTNRTPDQIRRDILRPYEVSVLRLSILACILGALALRLLSSCSQIEFGNADAGTETGDSGTQPIYEGGPLERYRCIRDPADRADMGNKGAPFQIWLDGTQLFNCYGEVVPPCHAIGYDPSLYDCSSDQLEP